MEVSSDLWKEEKVYYPSAIRETTPANFETVSALKEAEVARPEAALAVSTPNEPDEGGELPGVTETRGSSNPKAPQEAIGSIVSAQDSHVEKPPLLVHPLQTISPTDVPQGPEANPAQLPKEGDVSQGLEANPTQLPKEGDVLQGLEANPAQLPKEGAKIKLKK